MTIESDFEPPQNKLGLREWAVIGAFYPGALTRAWWAYARTFASLVWGAVTLGSEIVRAIIKPARLEATAQFYKTLDAGIDPPGA